LDHQAFTTEMTSSFPDHVALLSRFLDRHAEISEQIEHRLLNVQGKPITRERDRARFDQAFTACFYDSRMSSSLASLKGRLAAAHMADGFEAVFLEGRSHQLDPLELIIRAYDHWEHHRWPGKGGRLTFARTLFVASILRELEHLSLRIWDDGADPATPRLQAVQHLLDNLNTIGGSQAFVRDARWLIQTAQGPLTRRLEPYFKIADRIRHSLSAADRIELHKAGARLIGGHLRSQLHYRAQEIGVASDDPQVLAVTRNSNSMDIALLVRDLVPLLEAYKATADQSDSDHRFDLADAILQGLSADPELLLIRLDILGPSTMIEDVFLDRAPDGSVTYNAFGRTHVEALSQYAQLIGDLAPALRTDASRLNPAGAVYSPFAITYGFCADVLSNIALDTLHAQPTFGLTLEDVFRTTAHLDNKRARVDGWGKLPTQPGERQHFGHSLEWGVAIFERVMAGLAARGAHAFDANASVLSDARLFVCSNSGTNLPRDRVSAQEHCVTSDLKLALATRATAFPKSQVLSDRKEGRYLASAESNGHWFAVSKVLLTSYLCQGKDASIMDVPPAVVDVLRLTCPALVVASP